MEFTNNHMKLDGDISIESLQFKSLSPTYRATNIKLSLVITSFLAAVLLCFSVQTFIDINSVNQQTFKVTLVSLTGLSVLRAIYHYFADPMKQYALRERDMHYKSGLIFTQTVSQPVLRIQHIEIERGPIERFVGLSTLQVFSAGGSAYTFQIPGLTAEDAIALRQFILNNKDTVSYD